MNQKKDTIFKNIDLIAIISYILMFFVNNTLKIILYCSFGLFFMACLLIKFEKINE